MTAEGANVAPERTEVSEDQEKMARPKRATSNSQSSQGEEPPAASARSESSDELEHYEKKWRALKEILRTRYLKHYRIGSTNSNTLR